MTASMKRILRRTTCRVHTAQRRRRGCSFHRALRKTPINAREPNIPGDHSCRRWTVARQRPHSKCHSTCCPLQPGNCSPGARTFPVFFSGIQTPFASVLVSHTSGDTQRLLIGDGALVRVPRAMELRSGLSAGASLAGKDFFRRFVDTGVPVGPKNLRFGVEPVIEVGGPTHCTA